MDKNTESNIINIPKGFPDWDKPLMKNLHILEGMIKDIESVEGLEDIKEDLKSLSRKVSEIERKHNIDLENVNIKITKIERNLLKLEEKIDNIPTVNIEDIENEIKNINQKNIEQDEEIESQNKKISNNSQLIETNTKNINNSKETIEENSNNIEDIKKRTIANKNDIDNLSKDLDGKISDVQINIDENKDNINKNTESINNNTKKIDEIKISITKINEDIKQMDKDIEEGLELLSNYHFIVSTTAEMGALESVQEKSLCYVRKTGELFIYDGQWKVISTGEGGEISLEWNKIIGKPISTPEYIDTSVKNSHRHENMFVLDKITEEKIIEWNEKANKSDIPTKMSQLSNDSGYVDDSKLNQSIQKLDNEINRLDKEKASQIDLDALREVVETLTGDEGGEIDLTEFAERLKNVETEKLNTKDLVTEINKINDELGFLTSETLKEDSSIKLINESISQLSLDLKGKANKIDIPNKVSQLENDKGYITEADIDLTEVNENIKELQDNKANKIHTHSSNDISVDDKTLAEALETINNTLDNKANSSELKTKLSEFENDTKFTTLDEVNKSDTIKNINVELAKKVDKSEKGKADGVVPLDKDSKIALEYLPDLSKQQTHIVETIEDMQKLENLIAGDKTFVVASGDSYIWNGSEWKILSKAEWENINLDWANIINNPLTSDDLVNIPKIPTKADKTEIPTKTSQLNNDNGYITMEDVPVVDLSEIEKNLDNLNTTKANKEAIPTKISELENDKLFITPETLKTNPDISEIKSSLIDKIDKSEKGKASGVVPLDKNSQISLEYLPDISKQQVYIVNTKEEMDELSNLIAGDRAYILDSGDAYIWNGEEWKVVSKAEWADVKLDWTHIENNPISEIDLSNIKTISDKANKTEVPTKISQLTDDTTFKEDIGNLNKNKVDKEVGKSLSTNDYTDKDKELVLTISTKAEKTHSHKIEDIELLSEKLLEVDNSILNKAEKSFVEEQIKEVKTLVNNIDIPEVDLSGINKQLADLTLNKADKEALELIQETINSNKEKWSKDTVYDDTEVKALIDLKADKKSLDSGLSKKVDKVDGKTLSTNDYSDLDKIEVGKVKDKADKSALALKADKSAVDKISTDIADNRAKWEKDTIYDDTTIKNTITKKADTAYVETELGKKVDIVEGKGLSTNDYTTADKNEVIKIKDKADNSALNAIVTQIADNKELWEKDTIYDDSSIKTELETKADKTEILSIFTQENEPKNMKIGDQWHQIVNN